MYQISSRRFLIGFIFFFSASLSAMEGIYSGLITPFDKNLDPIDLQVSFARTGNTGFDAYGFEHPIIATAILVGQEGGPYSCENLSIDFDESEVDIQYVRSGKNQDASADFRLVGSILAPDLVAGKVFSKRGSEGSVFGTFRIQKSEHHFFDRKDRYIGDWEGFAVTAEGAQVPMVISITKVDFAGVNPEQYEFAYTPGKIAAVRWNRTRQGIDKVYVDYLRNSVQLLKSDSRGGAGISIEFKLRADRSIEGFIKGAQAGRTARFVLEER